MLPLCEPEQLMRTRIFASEAKVVDVVVYNTKEI
jgi:hypothetical protein